MKAVVTSLNEVKHAMNDIVNQQNIFQIVSDLRARVAKLEAQQNSPYKPEKKPKEYQRAPSFHAWILERMADGKVYSALFLHEELARVWLDSYGIAPTAKGVGSVLSRLAVEGKITRVASLHYKIKQEA